MTDTAEYVEKLRVTDPLRAPLLRAAIAALELAKAGHGLDAGCAVSGFRSPCWQRQWDQMGMSQDST